MHLKNGRWVKGPPPVNKGVQRGSPHPETAQKIIKHRPQASRPRSQVGNIDALLQGKSVSICVQRCLAPWTKILMADGLLKPIVEIEPGDFVINNQGESTRVLTKTYSGRADKLIRIRSDRMLDPITCTPEHKFYALDLRGTNFSSYNGVTTFIKKKKNIADFIKWVPVKELNDETFLLTPTNCKLDLVDKGKIDLADYIPKNGTTKITDTELLSVGRPDKSGLKEVVEKVPGASYWQVVEVSRNRVKFTKEIHYRIKEELDKFDFHTRTKRFVLVGYDLGKFFGVLLGDGSHRLRHKDGNVSSGEISIAFNSDYENQISGIEKIIKNLFGLECSRYKSHKTNCIQLIFYSIPIARMLKDFGKRTEKKLPPEFLFANGDYLKGLLDGLIQADGHIEKCGAGSFGNTSPYLISLCYWIQNQLGRNPKITLQGPRSQSFLNGRQIKSNYRSLRVRPLVSKGSDSHQRIISNNGIRYDVSKIMTKEILEDQDQDVWDIGVAEHRSFIAENINVSNSLGGLGDIIMSTPISRGAKRKYPNCEVTYSVDTEAYSGAFADVLLYNPFIDNIIDYRIAVKDDYHIFSDITRAGLMYEKPSTVFPNRIDLFARSARIPLFGQNLPIYVSTEEEDKWGQEFIEKHIGTKDVKGLIAIHLRSNDPKRTWPKERIRAFINLAQQRGYWIFLFDWLVNSTEWQLARTTQVFDYEVRRAASILKHCDVLVCPDSSMLHLAGALNLKIVSLFGSMPPSSRINHYPNATAVINQKLGCLGCVYSACKFKYYCMSSIQPETVISAVERKLMDPKVEVGNLDTSIITEPEEHYPKEIGTVEL